MVMKNSNDDAMLGALDTGTDLPEDVRRTLGLSDFDDDESILETPQKKPVQKQIAAKSSSKPTNKLGTAGRLKIDVETLRRDSTHQLGHVIDEAIAFRLKRAVFEQKMTRGSYRTERAVIEAALNDWLDRYDAGDRAEAA